MSTLDDTILQWLDEDLEGVSTPEHQRELARVEAEDPAWRDERRALESLHALLAADRIPVREGFARQVTEALPVAPWEKRRAWRLPLAIFLVFGFGAAVLLAGADALSAGAMGAALAVVDLFQAAVLAGAGLVGATWRAPGAALAEWLAESRLNVVGLGVVALGFNLLLVRLLRRRNPARQAARVGDE